MPDPKPDDVEDVMKMPGGGKVPAPPQSAKEEVGERVKELQRPQFEPFVPAAGKTDAAIDLLKDVNLQVKVELGRSRMLVQDILKLSAGSVVELDRLTADPLDIYVNDRLVARGEVLVLDENFAIRITEVVQPPPRETT